MASRLLFWAHVILVIVWPANHAAFCEDMPTGVDFGREAFLPRDLAAFLNQSVEPTCGSHPWSRCRLFRMPVGAASEILALKSDVDDGADNPAWAVTGGQSLVALGADNPYFDFRRPGDHGGVGFYKFHSEVLVLDNTTSGLGFCFQAITPAGLEADGVEHGPTVLSPNFSWFQELGGGTALQGFIGKSLHMHSNWSDGLGQSIRYGLAFQSPFPGLQPGPSPKAHVFLEALGRSRYDGEAESHSPTDLELVPGVQWRWGDNRWISSGVLMPVDGLSPARLLWQVTCSWQY